MHAGQDNGARVRMAGAQIIKEFLAQIGHGIDIEHEKIRAIAQDEALRLLQVVRQIDLRGRRGFTQGGENLRGKILLGFEHKDAPALLDRISGLGCFVHV
jgi:hypothetical protein